MILLLIVILLFICYSAFIFYYWQSWKSIPDYISSNQRAQTKISVIIPARNEEENISKLLKALNDQSYPKEFFEVIVVDDHSTDNTAAIVKEFYPVKLLTLKDDNINSYKKKAIETGVATATGEGDRAGGVLRLAGRAQRGGQERPRRAEARAEDHELDFRIAWSSAIVNHSNRGLPSTWTANVRPRRRWSFRTDRRNPVQRLSFAGPVRWPNRPWPRR